MDNSGNFVSHQLLRKATTGGARKAMLQVNCALADVPLEHSVEGVQLTIESNGGTFTESVNGRVMFLATRSQAVAQPNSYEP